ncbi:unnamed protein product [Miscanthus lutarioriparius]|uniref:Uncharacterized protein n=1 Tax=Miscanthus lutarioriparius TaxID=422564 RepID=A0A811RIU6_9POAL|nr:unnamed protein product [Miscanthus lutarioriparius]
MEREESERERERERGVVPQPPAKRMKLAPVVPTAAGGGGGGGGGQVASPRWRRLRQTLLVVLFLEDHGDGQHLHLPNRSHASEICRLHLSQVSWDDFQVLISAFQEREIGSIGSKLESFQEQIEGLRHEVTQLSRLCSNRHTDQQTRLEANQEHIAANGSNTDTRLCFLNGLEPPVYTEENLTSQNHAAIKLAMFQGDKVVESGALSEAKIEILVLRGDFSNKCRDNWTEDEFDKHILQGRDGHDLVLGTVWLTNGMAELSQIRFREGSSRKNVIMAARVCKNKKTCGRVQEAIMKPVKVLDRRNKPNEKRHPPRLDDDLYRLEEIARDGAYHRRLQEVQIYKVGGFLKALNEDSNKLRAILKMENQQNAWSKLTEHARECVLEDRQELKQYHSKEGNVVFFFNCVHELVGAAFPHEYVACQRFNTAQKALVNKWRLHAYEKLKDISPDFVMKGNFPEPVSSSTDVAAAPSVLAVGASQQVFSTNQLAYQGTGAAEYLAHNEHVMGHISPVANCGPTIPNNGPNTHYYQGTGTAENLPQGEHGTPYQIADCGPIVADPDYLNTRYCQGQGIPLHSQQQVISPWPQNPQGMMDFACPIELAGMNFDLYQDSGASTSAQAQLMFGPRNPTQPESTNPAAAPPWMPSMAEQDQGPSCSGFPGSGHPNDFQ